MSRAWYWGFLIFGCLVLGFSVLKVRGLAPERWISFGREEDVYGELEYLRDNWDWAGQLVSDRFAYWTARNDAARGMVLFEFSATRARRASEVMTDGHWFLSMHMRRKGSIYALEGIKMVESGYQSGEIKKEEIVRLRGEMEKQLEELGRLRVERQDLRDIESKTKENLEIVLKQLKAMENS